MFIIFPKLRLRISVIAIPLMILMLWLEGLEAFLIIFGSAFIHEWGHIFAMRLCGYSVRRIDILPMGALIVCPEGIPNKSEALIALSGPFASLFLASVAASMYYSHQKLNFLFAMVVNLIFGIFNLLPVEKLDGGKALSCFLSDKKETEAALQICKVASTVAKVLFISFCMFSVVASCYNLGVAVLALSLIIQLLK